MKDEYTIAILGLDNAGKSSAVMRMKGEEGSPIKAGWGFNTCTVSFKFQKVVKMMCFSYETAQEVLVNLYDIGGDLKFRKIWSNYYADIYGCVYVVNCLDKSRINESSIALHEMYKNELMNGKPLLILANGCEERNVQELSLQLNIKALIPQNFSCARNSLICVMPCRLSQKSKGLNDGMDWLIRAIGMNHTYLHKRVTQDTLKQKQRWEAEKKIKTVERNIRKSQEILKSPDDRKTYPLSESTSPKETGSPFQLKKVSSVNISSPSNFKTIYSSASIQDVKNVIDLKDKPNVNDKNAKKIYPE